MTALWNSLRRTSSTAGVAELRRGQAIFVALALCGLVMLYLLGLLTRAGAPSGSDPGNWLAFSHELFGERVKAAAATYPPVAPALVKWLSLFFPPLVSVSILGAATSVLIGIPFFLLVHQRAGILWALLFTPGVLFLGYSMEMLAWGGYPQLLSQALLLFTLYWLGKGLLENRRLFLVLGAASASLSVGTSTFGVVFLGVAVPLSLLFLVTQERLHVREVALRVGVWGALVVGMSLLFLPFYLNTIELQEGRAWNPHGYSLATSPAAFAYVFQEWPDAVGRLLLLLPLVVGLTLYCGWPRERASSLAAASASLMLSSLLLFFTFFEVRVLSLLEIGVLGALVFLFSDLFRQFERARSHPVMVTAGRVGVGAVAVLLATVVIVLGQQRLVRALEWYRVLDGDVVAGLDWLRENALPESVVVASGTPRGYNYGWWIEGYAKIPTYNAIDPQWVIFREEKRQSRVAHQLLESRSGAEIAGLAQQYGIRYVFLDKRVGVGSSELVKGGFTPVFDRPTVTILRFSSLPTGSPPLREALADGVGGSPERPFEAFQDWEEGRGR